MNDRYNQILAVLEDEKCVDDIIRLTGLTKGAVQYALKNMVHKRYIKQTSKYISGKPLFYKREVNKVRNVIDKKSDFYSQPHNIPQGGRIISFDDKSLQGKLAETQRLRDRERKSRKVSIASTFEMVI